MKKIFLYWAIWNFIVSLTMFLPNARASDQGEERKNFDFSVKGIYSIYRDRDLRDDGKGVKGEFRYKYFYLWGSWEYTELRLSGQTQGDINLFGFGLGGKIEIVKGLSAFIEAGCYIPDAELEGLAGDPASNEGVRYKWYVDLHEKGLGHLYNKFNVYTYDLKSGLGGSLGVEFKQDIYKGLSVNAFGMYRFLNLKEDWDAFSPSVSDMCLQTKEKRDFSGAVFGVGLSYGW